MWGTQSQEKVVELEGRIKDYPIIHKFEVLSGFKARSLIYAAGGLIFVMFIIGFAGRLLANLLGFVYPTYRSIKAIESKGKSDDKQWLLYWIVYSFMVVAEELLGVVLERIPFYYFIKLIFLIYLFAPGTKGASKVYNVLIKPRIMGYVNVIDQHLEAVSPSLAGKKVKKTKSKGNDSDSSEEEISLLKHGKSNENVPVIKSS